MGTFHLVCLGWLIFRAKSLEQIGGMLSAIVHRPTIPALPYLLPVSAAILPLIAVQLAQYLTNDLNVVFRTPWYVRSLFYAGCFYAFVLAGVQQGGRFIYFQF